MLDVVILHVVSAALGAVVGFAALRGTACSLLAAEEIVNEGRAARLASFFIASAAAMAVLQILAWVFPMSLIPPPHFRPTVWVLAGGLLFGLGVWLNGGCAFGTLVRISSGDCNFLFMPLGAIAGYLIARRLNYIVPHPIAPFVHFGADKLAWILSLPALIAVAVVALQAFRRGGNGDWSLYFSMLLVGSAGGALFGLAGGWTYASLLQGGVIALMGGMTDWRPQAITACLSMVAGAIFAAIRAKRFHLSSFNATQAVRSVFGGLLMGLGAVLIPGSNDALVMYHLPNLAPNALMGYAAMFCAVILLTSLQRLRMPLGIG